MPTRGGQCVGGLTRFSCLQKVCKRHRRRHPFPGHRIGQGLEDDLVILADEAGRATRGNIPVAVERVRGARSGCRPPNIGGPGWRGAMVFQKKCDDVVRVFHLILGCGSHNVLCSNRQRGFLMDAVASAPLRSEYHGKAHSHEARLP